MRMLPRSDMLTAGEWALVDAFHRLFYEKHVVGMPHWLGIPMLKTPMDAWTYQELFWVTRPDWVIESGSCWGGSALYFASMLEAIGHGQVLSVDITDDVAGLWRWAAKLDAETPVPFTERPTHPRLTYLCADICEPETVAQIATMVSGKVMVICDSAHEEEHVSVELMRLAPLVTPGCYLVVEDTNISGHPVQVGPSPGPYEAVVAFLEKHPEFAVDLCAGERFLVSMHTWLYKRPREEASCPQP